MLLRSSKKPRQGLRVASPFNSPLQLRPTALSFMDLEDSPGVVTLDSSFSELSSSNAAFLGSPVNQYSCPDGIVTQTLVDPHLAPSQVGPLTQILKDISEESTSQTQLPSCVEPRNSISSARWGDLSGPEIAVQVNSAYDLVMTWRRNLFQVPTGKAGRLFIEELTKTIVNFTSSTALEEVALTMTMIMPALLLQKPSRKSKTKEHVAYLDKRLKWWQDGHRDLLVREGAAIQKKLAKFKVSADHSEKVFVKLMLQGKVCSAMRWIGSQSTTVLPADPRVMDELERLHPQKSPASPSTILHGPMQKIEAVIFDGIDGEMIERCAKRTQGSSGPSGLDADGWKRLLCSKQFKSKTEELCGSIADLARKLCSTHINPEYTRAFSACRLVPISKPPDGVRPVGVGEVLRRIIGKALMQVMNPELVNATAPIQVCSGLPGGVEAAVHALRRLYEDDDTEAVILVDADNAFNRMNRSVALNNIQFTCPEMATYIINTYRKPAQLFVSGAVQPLLSEEGVTQGDNAAMGYYACSMMPLIMKLMLCEDKAEYEKLLQLWYADDAAAGGKLRDMLKWWSMLCETGPLYGYHPKPSKSWVIVKPQFYEKAKEMFPDLQVTDMGHKYLGSYIGREEGKDKFVEEKVQEWIKDVEQLSDIAKREPQVAYSAYIYGLSKRWNYVCRTTQNTRKYPIV